MNQANNLAGRPNAVFSVAVHKDLLSSLTAHKRRNLGKLALLTLLLDLESLQGNLVLEESGSVSPSAHEEGCVGLVGAHNLLLDLLVHWSLDGAHESRSHVDSRSAEAQRGSESVTISEATAGDEGDAESLAGLAEQDKVCNVALADVSTALKTVDTEEVDAQLDGALSMANRGALVEDNDAGLLQLRYDRPGRVSCGLDDLDPLVDDGLSVCGVVRGHHGGKKGDVDTEGVLGEGAAALDLLAQFLGAGEDEGGDDTQASGVGDG